MELSNLQKQEGATKPPRRVGRGPGSGWGKTCGRGQKGYKSRSGSKKRHGFEGGQMPLHRRLPKFGFTNIFRTEYTVINIETLEKLGDLDSGDMVTKEVLRSKRIIRSLKRPVKLTTDLIQIPIPSTREERRRMNPGGRRTRRLSVQNGVEPGRALSASSVRRGDDENAGVTRRSVIGFEQPAEGRFRLAQTRVGQYHGSGFAYRIGNQSLIVKPVHRGRGGDPFPGLRAPGTALPPWRASP